MAGTADGDPVGFQHGPLTERGLRAGVPHQPGPPDVPVPVAPPPRPPAPAQRLPPEQQPWPDQQPSPAAQGRPDPAPARSRRGRRAAGMVVRGAGELLITLGLLVGLFLAYQLWITDIFQARSQAKLHTQLAQAWTGPAKPAPTAPASPPPAARPHPGDGQGFAVLHIPRFGADYAPVIVEGVDENDLEKGPGHYPGTAMPGEIGNFVVSGHRTTYGKPFNRLDELRDGDPIVVEVADRYYVYRMTRSEVVQPTALDVTFPVPEQPGRTPTSAVLTMTTCNPKYSAKTRLIVFATLDSTVMKGSGAGVPFEQGEG